MRTDLLKVVAPTVEATGYIFWGLEFRPFGRSKNLLRVYIDHENGIVVEDCEKVSRELSRMLDVEDPIRGEYILEVSSPGVNRRLFFVEQYPHFCGEIIDIKTKKMIEGRKNFKGILVEVIEGVLQVKDSERTYAIPFQDVFTASVETI